MNLFKTTSQLIGKPYNLGCQDINNGLDCFTIAITYLRQCGIDIPEDTKYKSFTFDNYKEAYLNDPKVLNVGIEYISNITKEVKANQAVAGDILVIKDENGNEGLAIDGGNGNMISAVKEIGITTLKKKNYSILRAFRCQ